MSTSPAALCELCVTGISRRKPCPGCHPRAPWGCAAGGCWMLSWQNGLQKFWGFFCQKSPHEPDMNTLELPAKLGDSEKLVALSVWDSPSTSVVWTGNLKPWITAPSARAKQTQKQSSLPSQAVTVSFAGPPACMCTSPSLLKETGDEVQSAGEGSKLLKADLTDLVPE